MWKIKFWFTIAEMYDRLAGVTLGVSRFFVTRSKNGIKKHNEYYVKYIESKERNHEYLK